MSNYQEFYLIIIAFIGILTLITIFEKNTVARLHKIKIFSIIFIFFIIMYSIFIRYSTKIYSHQVVKNNKSLLIKNSGMNDGAILNKIFIRANNPFDPNINPSYFNNIILLYTTDSIGYIIDKRPDLSFLGITILNWTQVYTSEVRIDTGNKNSKFTIIAAPLNLPMPVQIGFDFTIKTNGRIDIKRYKVQNK